MVLPLNAEGRLNKVWELREIAPLNEDGQRILIELRSIMRGLQLVRNNVIHAFVREDANGGAAFYLRSKNRALTREQVFSSEELTNYAGHLAWALWCAVGREGSSHSYSLPERPDIPEFLRSMIQFPKT